MQGNLKWKVVSFMLPVPMSEVCIWSINYLVMSILLAEMCQWIAIFTNVTFAHYLKEKKMTLVGTMRVNRKGIPKEPVEMQSRDDKDIKFVYANVDDMMLASHVVKKKSGKINTLLLNTMHDDVRCSRDQRKKTNIVCFYDKTITTRIAFHKQQGLSQTPDPVSKIGECWYL